MNQQNIYEAVLQLRLSPQFAVLLEWFEGKQAEALRVLTHSTDDRTIHVAQGTYRSVQDFKDLIDNASRAVDKRSQ